MQNVLSNREKLEERLFVFPNSALKHDKVKINYAQFLKNTQDVGCCKAIKVIGGRIDLHKINSIIDDTTFISDTHKFFLKTMIKERKENIIDKALLRFQA